MNGPRIVLVDDEPSFRFLVCAWFSEQGYPCTSHAQSAAALTDLETGSEVALLLIDVVLRDYYDGLDLCAVARALHPRLPIILLSARHRPDDRCKGLAAGANYYLNKPFEIEELHALVVNLIGPPGIQLVTRQTAQTSPA